MFLCQNNVILVLLRMIIRIGLLYYETFPFNTLTETRATHKSLCLGKSKGISYK